MSNNLYITSTEARSGKSLISLGVMEMLLCKIDRVGFFRPIINMYPGLKNPDNDINLIYSRFKLEIPYEKMYGCTSKDVENLVAAGKDGEILERIIKKYNQLTEICDFVLCEGTDFASSTASFELDINAEISKNLGSPVLLVANAYQKSMDDTLRSIELSIDSEKNNKNGKEIRQVNIESSEVRILVVPTNEELKIAQETEKVIKKILT